MQLNHRGAGPHLALSQPGSVPAQLCPIPALSSPGSVPSWLCPCPALSLPGSVPSQLCPIPALSSPGSVPSWLCPHPALSGIQLKSPASQQLSPRLTERKVPGEPCSVLSRGVARDSPRRQGRRQSGALACLLIAPQLELDLSPERLPPPALPSTPTTSHDLPSQWRTRHLPGQVGPHTFPEL